MGECGITDKVHRDRVHLINGALPNIRFPSIAFQKVHDSVRLGALTPADGSACMMLIDLACVPEMRQDLSDLQ